MKTLYCLIVPALLVLLLIFATHDVSAQRIVKVTSDIEGNLNNVINGDTTVTGARVDPNTIYELARNGYYVTLGTIENHNYHLHIRAEAGTGFKPIIRPGVVAGGISSRPLSLYGDFTLDGVLLSDYDNVGGFKQYVVKISADNLRITILNSHIDRDGQIAIRCDGKNATIIVKNSIISNIGTMASASNGRGVDDRGTDIDTLIYENNTFYNLTSRIIRDGGGIIKYCKINHNTVVNVGQMGCTMGPIIKGSFTNNLFVNTAFLGNDTASSASINYTIGTGALSQAWLDSGNVQKLEIHNNNFYMSPEFGSAFLTAGRKPAPIFDAFADSVIAAGGWSSTNTNLPVSFTSSPQVPLQVMLDYFNPAVTAKPEMDFGLPPGALDPYDVGVVLEPFNFAYPTSSPLYTAGTSGQPLGDLNYFGMQPVGDGTGVNKGEIVPPSEYQLYANYPNPFNPTTNIQYTLPIAVGVKLEIVNTLGQTINTLVNQRQQAGTHSVVWDGRDMNGHPVSTGVYFYRLRTANTVLAKKMMLIK